MSVNVLHRSCAVPFGVLDLIIPDPLRLIDAARTVLSSGCGSNARLPLYFTQYPHSNASSTCQLRSLWSQTDEASCLLEQLPILEHSMSEVHSEARKVSATVLSTGMSGWARTDNSRWRPAACGSRSVVHIWVVNEA